MHLLFSSRPALTNPGRGFSLSGSLTPGLLILWGCTFVNSESDCSVEIQRRFPVRKPLNVVRWIPESMFRCSIDSRFSQLQLEGGPKG
jgi:hypothetical protein